MKTFILAISSVAFLFSPSLIFSKEKADTLISMQESQQLALGISTSKAKLVERAWGISFPAKVIVPNSQLRVVATPLGGLLESLKVSEGEEVEKGQILAIVHSQELLEKQGEYLEALIELDLDSTVRGQQLLGKQSDYLGALVELNLAATEMNRDKSLSLKGVISRQRFQESTAKYRQLKTRVEQYQQSLELAGMSKAAVVKLKRTQKMSPYDLARNESKSLKYQESSVKYRQLKTRAEHFRQVLELAGMSKSAIKTLTKTHKLSPLLEVKSPLSGVVLDQSVTPGSQLESLDPIYKVGYLTPLWIEIHVPLDKLGDVTIDTKVRIVNPPLEGKVITVGRMVHGADQGVLVRATVNEKTDQLRPGQFVQSQIAHSNGNNVKWFRIPRNSLVRNNEKTWVFLKKKNGFQPLPIKIEKEEADSLVISGDISNDLAVVINGAAALKSIWLEGAE